jgi:hypothetical protein
VDFRGGICRSPCTLNHWGCNTSSVPPCPPPAALSPPLKVERPLLPTLSVSTRLMAEPPLRLFHPWPDSVARWLPARTRLEASSALAPDSRPDGMGYKSTPEPMH